jgi:ABC-2 type transport system permease protein
MQSTQGFHVIMNIALVPLWLLSGALFPSNGAAGWVQAVMTLNPLTPAVAMLRALLTGEVGIGMGSASAWLAAFAALTISVATLLVSRPQRT